MKKNVLFLLLSSFMLTACSKSQFTTQTPTPTPMAAADNLIGKDLSGKKSFNCFTSLGSDIFSANNPDKQGVTVSTVNPKREFTISNFGTYITVSGEIVSNYIPTEKWTIVSNSDTELIAYSHQSKAETLKTNFLTLSLDKKTGQGFLGGNSSFVYQNRNIDNFSFYVTCK